MNNQYINNSTEEEQPKGFNKTGVLLLKNRIDKMEYHLYNNKLPAPNFVESVDLNATLDIHTYNVIRKPIHISIECDNQILLDRTGTLKKKLEHGVDKYYLVADGFIDEDIEEILFENCERMTNIKINTVHNEETDEVKEGENKVNGLQES